MTTARTSLISLLFAPVTVMTRSMRISAKLGLIVVVMLLPLAMLMVTVVRREGAAVEAVRLELSGIPVAHELIDLEDRLRSYQSVRALVSSVPAARSQLDETRNALLKAVAAVDGVVPASGLDLSTPWTGLRDRILRDTRDEATSSTDRNGHQPNATVRETQALVSLVTEKSGLLLDPESATFLLMDLALERMSIHVEALAELRDIAAQALAHGSWQPGDTVALAVTRRQFEDSRIDLQGRLDALERAGEKAPPGWKEASTAADRYIAQIEAIAAAGVAPRGEPLAMLRSGNELLDKIDVFHNQAIHRLQELLAQRHAQLVQNRNLMATAAISGVLLALYLSIGVTRSMRRTAQFITPPRRRRGLRGA